MSTITISKMKYEALRRRASAYDKLIAVARDEVFSSPPMRDVNEIMRDFRATKKYSPAFLKSLKMGLLRSPYFKTR